MVHVHTAFIALHLDTKIASLIIAFETYAGNMGVDFISCSLSAKKTAANTARKNRRFKNGLNHGGSQWSLDCCNKHLIKFRVLLRSFCGRDEPSIYTSPISNQNFPMLNNMKYEAIK